MNIDMLKTFCSVVTEGSMTTAGSKAAFSQPAVTRHIRELEKEFGAKLLHRKSQRKIRLTAQGQLLYENAHRILSLLERAKSSIQAVSLDLAGESISAITLNSLGLYLISPIIGNFLRLNDNMKLSLLYGNGRDIIRSMQRNAVDIALAPDLRKEYGTELPQFKKICLFTDYMYFVGSGRDKTLPDSMSLQDIFKRRLACMDESLYPSFQSYLFNKIREEGGDAPRNEPNLAGFSEGGAEAGANANVNVNPGGGKEAVRPSFESDNAGTLKRVIEHGLGWGFLPAHSIKKQLRAGRLSHIPVEGVSYSMEINLYWRPNPKKEQIINILTKMIQKQAEESA